MVKRIQRVLDELEALLQCTERALRQDLQCYSTYQLLCMGCGRSLPADAKKCHPCRNTDLLVKYCTQQTRVADYLDILSKANLWPTVTSFAESSVSGISSRFLCAKKDVKHSCEAGRSCPLLKILDLMTDRANESQDWANGLCLRCVRDGEDEEGFACAHV
jgi:ribosomal protein L40E